MAQLKCDVCLESFNRQSSLTRHKNNFHSSQYYKNECTTCFKKFSRKDLLLRHERLHRGDGLKPCGICHREFRGDYLAKHVRGCCLRQLKRLSKGSMMGYLDNAVMGPTSKSCQLHWQDPEVGPPAQNSTNDEDQITRRRVQQPHRYVLTQRSSRLTTEVELLYHTITAIEDNNGGISTLKAATDAWQAQGRQMKRLDELCVATFGSTLIAHACLHVRYEGVEFITTLDLDFNLQDDRGRTALHWLSRSGLTALSLEMINKTADVNARDFDLDTPLCLASKSGHVGVMKLLCDHGADVNASMACSPDALESEALPYTPLEHSICSRSEEAISVLLRAGADPNLKGERLPLETAILSGSAKAVELLLHSGADMYLIEAEFVDLLLRDDHAASARDIGIQEAVQKFESIDTHAKTHRSNNKTVSRTFDVLEQQAELLSIIGSDDISKLMEIYNRLRTVDIVLGELKNLVETWPLDAPENLVMRAASAGSDRCLRYMLRYWPDLDPTGLHGWCALHYACNSGSDQTVQLLLEHGARKESCSERGETPLCIAANRGYLEIMTTLLNAGANMNGGPSLVHGSPLHAACEGNQEHAVALLLSWKVDVQIGRGNLSPLETALFQCSANMVSTLLRAGASTKLISRPDWIRGLRMTATRRGPYRIPEPAEKVSLLEAICVERDSS